LDIQLGDALANLAHSLFDGFRFIPFPIPHQIPNLLGTGVPFCAQHLLFFEQSTPFLVQSQDLIDGGLSVKILERFFDPVRVFANVRNVQHFISLLKMEMSCSATAATQLMEQDWQSFEKPPFL
jgi:hypothetical protein